MHLSSVKCKRKMFLAIVVYKICLMQQMLRNERSGLNVSNSIEITQRVL